MDFPVEATVLVDHFLDQVEVQRLLGSHGFKVEDLGGGQLQIHGYFQNLKALKVRLEQLLLSESGAGNNRDGGGASSSSPTHQDRRRSWSGARRASGGEWTVVDGDVFRYARQLGSKELQNILSCSDLQIRTSDDGGSTSIRVLGRRSRTAVGPLQNLLDDLNKSLRTQEVPLRDLDQQGRVLLRRIQKNQNVSESVLVCELEDRLHLIGPSKDSYELKQRLLGRPIDQSGPRGRSGDRTTSRWRSSSVPLMGSKTLRRDGGPVGPSAGGLDPSRPPRTRSFSRAAGFSPSGPDPSRPPWGQSVSRSWDMGQAEKKSRREPRNCSVL